MSQIREKIKNLRSYYQRELRKTRGKTVGSSWTFFNDLQFLKDFLTPGRDSLESQNQDTDYLESLIPSSLSQEQAEEDEAANITGGIGVTFDSPEAPKHSRLHTKRSHAATYRNHAKKIKKEAESGGMDVQEFFERGSGASELEKLEEYHFGISVAQTLESIQGYGRDWAKVEIQKILLLAKYEYKQPSLQHPQ